MVLQDLHLVHRAHIQDNARADGLTGQAASRASGSDGDTVLMGKANGLFHIGMAVHADDGQGREADRTHIGRITQTAHLADLNLGFGDAGLDKTLAYCLFIHLSMRFSCVPS